LAKDFTRRPLGQKISRVHVARAYPDLGGRREPEFDGKWIARVVQRRPCCRHWRGWTALYRVVGNLQSLGLVHAFARDLRWELVVIGFGRKPDLPLPRVAVERGDEGVVLGAAILQP
jgi:hypothetical protein